ncbi:MAG: Crp/Fnr family transcriptional regulator [Saprospiraceae bacterium]|nr:Crp/Fnr family transcriptional regulator [Saprospiraceae bacterium]
MNNTLFKIYQHPALKHDKLEAMFNMHTRVTILKGEFLLKQGQTASEYYCLESGLIRSYAISSEGKDITTGFFGQNEIVIEVASLFLRTPTSENIQALTDCICWQINLIDFQKLADTIPGFMEWGRAWMAGVLFATKQRSLSMITDPAIKRYQLLIEQHPNIIRHAKLRYIASYLGITDTSLSRIRKEMTHA